MAQLKEFIEALNHVGDNVWAIVLFIVAALLAVCSFWHPELLAFATTIATTAGVIFRGNTGQKQPPQV